MNILITRAATRLSQELAAALAKSHDVTLTERRQVSIQGSFTQSDLDYGDSLKALVRGKDAVIHSGEVDAGASVSDQLDEAMRCTYNLLWAAWEEGVPRFIYLSSLRVMENYPSEYAVTERWRPIPGVNPPVLCYHLGEFVCREFARESKVDVVCLRLGDMTTDFRATSDSALLYEDAAQAIEKALTGDFGVGAVGTRNAGPAAPKSYWNILHIQSNTPRKRYLTTAAEKALGYIPTKVG
jgi:hypothetical protein